MIYRIGCFKGEINGVVDKSIINKVIIKNIFMVSYCLIFSVELVLRFRIYRLKVGFGNFYGGEI